MKITSKKERELFTRAIKLILPYKFQYALAFIANVINISLGLIQPIVWGNLVSKLFSKDLNAIENLIVITFILYLLQTMFNFIQQYWFWVS